MEAPIARTALILFAFSALAACKIVVQPGSHGSIISGSGTVNCGSGETCVVDVEDGSIYSDVFTAVPDPGYVFVGWTRRKGNLCGGRTQPCALVNVPSDFTSLDITLNLQAQFEPESSLYIASMPESVQHGSTLSLQVESTYSDGQINAELVFGPTSMQVASDGLLQWRVDNVMFGPDQVVSFGIQRADEPGRVVEYSITVLDEDRQYPLAASGIQVPGSNYSITVGQFDDDPAAEILLTDTDDRVMTVEARDTGYVQDWLYPFEIVPSEIFSENSINQVLGADADEDGINEIYVLFDNAIYVIEDRNSLASRVYASEGNLELHSMAIADVDGDSGLEFVLLASTGVLVIDVLSGEMEKTIDVDENFSGFSSATVVVGNVDEDESLEVILGEGYVFDLSTDKLEWRYADEFGRAVALADANADGVFEIFASRFFEPPVLYSAVTKTVLLTIDDQRDADESVFAGNLDDDPEDELIVSGFGTVAAYNIDNLASAAVSEIWRTERRVPMGEGKSLTVADPDGDGLVDILWSIGTQNTGQDLLAVADVDDGELNVWTNFDPGEQDAFRLLGTTTAATGTPQAVFSTKSHLLTLDFDGTRKFSGEIDWRTRNSVMLDYDLDGQDEVLWRQRFGTGALVLQDIATFSEELEIFDDSENIAYQTVQRVQATADDYPDVLFTVPGGGLSLYDLQSAETIWSSSVDSFDIDALAAGDLNGDGYLDIAAARTSNRYLWLSDPDTGALPSEPAVSQNFVGWCDQLSIVDMDDDPGAEIVCRSGGQTTDLIIFDAEFQFERTLNLPYGISDIAFDEVDGKVKNLLLLVFDVWPHSNAAPGDRTVRLVSPQTGDEIWVSPAFFSAAGNLQLEKGPSGERRVVLATDRAVYVTR